MKSRRTCVGVALVVALTCAWRPGADEPTVAAQHAHPAHHCRLTGSHVSGVVSVDLRGGTHADLPLVDVSATVEMTPSLADVIVHVTAPMHFSGRFVSRDLGGPAAYVPRTYRAPSGGLRLDGNVPFEITLAGDTSMARARLPSPAGDGVLTLALPCTALRAGAPRTDTRPLPQPARQRFVAIAPGTNILSGAGTGHELARIERSDRSRAAVVFAGAVGELRNGFVRLTLNNGPVQIDGFVPEGAAAALEFVVATNVATGAYASPVESVSGMQRVRLPTGTAVYSNPTIEHAWTTLNAPLDVYLRTRTAGERSAILLAPGEIGTHPCRFDGVAGRVACGGARELPQLGLRVCSAEGCVDVAYVTPP
ncbi:MAG: hypothetical protein IPL19_03260 [Sandaracinaceae bacterium]|nr:hypothetical protein [Sandaracinaceae bacterium]